MSKTKFICLLVILITLFNLKAQKEANQWFFEQHNGLDFNGDSVKYLDNSQIGKNESSSSICDKNGQVLFYTNGITLYNKYNQIVKNGTDLGFPFNPNETTSRQGTLILKHPDNEELVYLFSSDFRGRSGGLVFSIVSIQGNNDSGEVISKKHKLTGAINEPISAVNHHNGRDIWIVCHSFGENYFHLYLLKKDGLVNCSVLNEIGSLHDGFYQSMAQVNLKFSPNGEMINQHESFWGTTETLTFDSQSGEIKKIKYTNYLAFVSGFEYSSNSKKLYLCEPDSGLAQIDLVSLKKVRILTIAESFIPEQIQLAPNGKIYGAMYNSKDLFVINRPNEEGDSCNVIIKKNFLQNNNITAMPNFNQSYFYTPAINYTYEMNCTKNSIQFWGKDTFGANSHLWQVRKLAIGNWQLGGSTKNINCTFSDTGTYEVRYIATNGTRADTVVKSIVLYDKIKQGFLGKDTAYAQGDLINKTLFAPVPNHCVRWYFDKLSTGSFKEKGSSSSLLADSVGTYICKVTNQAFCEVWDTIVISECINNLNQPSLFRSRDTLRTFHLNADSFVWYINNEVYKITKQPFLALTDTGTYRVEAAKKGHCNSSSIGTNYVQRLNVKGIRIEELGISVFPNPSNGNISIQSQNPFKMKINTVLGQTIYERENINNIHLPKGIYFLHFVVGEYRSVEKVIVW